ncbi:MAG: isoleucine--tRNA ligase [Actinobacteria bacterium]|nr:MAG: isoleucine--tRNA ligase [Actinomycetota bacterium]
MTKDRDGVFTRLRAKPDHPVLELEVLDRWDRDRTFQRLRELNRGRPKWSFIDGPVTANKILPVHTAWGRTLKDVFQRYKAMRGFDQRYQNGFDCQGLWIEVGVERELGLNSKREIESYGLAEFARRCREKVIWSAGELTRGEKRLGQWMDWGNDYYTFSDTNIEYIWRFLKLMHERGWLYLGNRSTEWCPRCGTSMSQHELSQGDVYREKTDPSVYVRFPLVERPGESLVVWTTTPWTLPANVAAAVKPDAEYILREDGAWVARARYPTDRATRAAPGSELVGLTYVGPFDHLPAAAGIKHRVIPWDEVSLEEGTGIVHIAPGAGTEDFELSRVHDLPVLVPVDEAGRFSDDYGWLHGLGTGESADQIVADLGERGRLEAAEEIVHRYPHCWRCQTPLIFRVTDDWFIAVDELRPRLLRASATVHWIPEYLGKGMEDWLRNMGDWNISRRRYYGLPLPFYPCSCGRVNVIGSKRELEERAISGLEQLEELHRPWIDDVPIRCESCGAGVRRIKEVGDVWLDAGIVPFSTLGWENPNRIEGGYATGASKGLSTADLPDHEYWEAWFPADWVSEMREQIRLWFYSQLFMSVALTDRAPFKEVLGYEKMLDEHGREMHGSWGNMIEAEDAFARMGADVMRWQFCSQPPDQDLLFGYGPGHEIKRRLLTFWNSVSFFVEYANIQGFRPDFADLSTSARGDLHPLDRWLVARTGKLVEEATAGYEASLTVDVIRAFDAFVDDVSTWYIRRSRRRFWGGEEAALRTLWTAVVAGVHVIAPIIPFLAESLWENLVARPCPDAPDSVFLAGWPRSEPYDSALLKEMEVARRVVELGRRARAEVGIKLRQPLRRAYVRGADGAEPYADEIRDELRVKDIGFDEGPVVRQALMPNLPVLGPRLGPKVADVRAALAAGDYEELPGGGVRVAGVDLDAEDVIRGERVAVEGWAVAAEGPISLALDVSLDDDLRLEGRALDMIRKLNDMRKEAGLELTDRIRVTLPETEADLLLHRDWIADEVLAVSIGTDPAAGEPRIAPA